MYCSKCGAQNRDNAKFCEACGNSFEASSQQNVVVSRQINGVEDLPEEYRPLTAWQFFWLSVLYVIPVLGFIFLIVHCFSGSRCRKSYARSHFCGLVIVLIIVAIAFIIMAANGTLAGILNNNKNS